MSGPDRPHLAAAPAPGADPVPDVVVELAGGEPIEPVWRNELGGRTFRIGQRYVKWNERGTGIDLGREHQRLQWIAGRHPAPTVVSWGERDDAQWLVTRALPGSAAVGPVWRERSSEAIIAIATGLRALHSVPIDDFPAAWTGQVWVGRRPPSLEPRPHVESPVLVHGDACAPNTLISPAGEWVGHVDMGALAIGDRWADLAIASMSLDWNYGEGHQPAFFDAYGIEPDERRIAYYRSLWDVES